jgi:hypothetical protein
MGCDLLYYFISSQEDYDKCIQLAYSDAFSTHEFLKDFSEWITVNADIDGYWVRESLLPIQRNKQRDESWHMMKDNEMKENNYKNEDTEFLLITFTKQQLETAVKYEIDNKCYLEASVYSSILYECFGGRYDDDDSTPPDNFEGIVLFASP